MNFDKKPSYEEFFTDHEPDEDILHGSVSFGFGNRKKTFSLAFFVVVLALGTGLLLNIFLQRLYSFVLYSQEDLKNLYLGNDVFKNVVEMFYTLVVVCFPLAFAFYLIRKVADKRVTIPLCKVKDRTDAALLIVAGLGVCMLANVLNSFLFSYLTSVGLGSKIYDYTLNNLKTGPVGFPMILLTVLHTAILPAVVEELAFRGFFMQPLRKYGDLFAVVTSGVMFGLMHGNLMQAPFAIISGIALGLLCVYTGSMWPGIILHCLNNLVSVLESEAVASVSGFGSIIISAVCSYGLIIAGLLAITAYLLKNRVLPVVSNYSAEQSGGRVAVFILTPSMLIAIIYFLYEIFSDIYVKG